MVLEIRGPSNYNEMQQYSKQPETGSESTSLLTLPTAQVIAGGCTFLELLNLLGHWYIGSCLIMLPLASGEVEGFGNGCSLWRLQLQSDDSIHQAAYGKKKKHVTNSNPSL